MITESDAYKEHRGATLAWALLASLFTNFLGWLVVLFFAGIHPVPPPEIQQREYMVSSSSLTIARRDVPQRQHRVTPPARAQQEAQTHPQAQPQQRVAIVQTQATQPLPHPPDKTTPHLQTQFSVPARAPLSIATLAPHPPSSTHQTFADINGVDLREHVEAVLLPDPNNHRIENGQSCYYYVHYSAQWSGGGSEDGTIPWPVCYPADHDAMQPLNRVHNLPIPAPPAGWPLPPGTPLGPLLAAIYQRQIHS